MGKVRSAFDTEQPPAFHFMNAGGCFVFTVLSFFRLAVFSAQTGNHRAVPRKKMASVPGPE